MTKHIAVLTNGWVLIGNRKAGEKICLTNAAVIRNWGTTKGLGEIAFNGPTKSTVLDECGDIEIPFHAVLFFIACTYENKTR